jgi:hypothetical protein
MKIYKIFIFIGCFQHEVEDWQNELIKKLPEGISNKIFILPEIKEIEYSHFDKSIHADKFKYKQQYGKLYYTFKNIVSYMNEIKDDFHFVIKLRFDIIYKNDNYFHPEWFKILKDNALMVPSTEFHCFDRWNERNPSMWSDGMCEQIVAGNKKMMTIYFELFKCIKYFNNHTIRKGIESIMADYMLLNKIIIATFDLQYSQPGGKFVLGKNNNWLNNRENKLIYCK